MRPLGSSRTSGRGPRRDRAAGERQRGAAASYLASQTARNSSVAKPRRLDVRRVALEHLRRRSRGPPRHRGRHVGPRPWAAGPAGDGGVRRSAASSSCRRRARASSNMLADRARVAADQLNISRSARRRKKNARYASPTNSGARGRPRPGGGTRLAHLGGELLDQRAEHRLLVGEVVVERAGREIRAPDDVAHRRRRRSRARRRPRARREDRRPVRGLRLRALARVDQVGGGHAVSRSSWPALLPRGPAAGTPRPRALGTTLDLALRAR